MAEVSNATSLFLPKLVIFDCDGVIADSILTHGEVWSQNLARYGLDLSPQECMDKLGAGKMSAIGDNATGLGAKLPNNWVDEIYVELYARLEQGVPLIAGVMDVIHQLEAADIPICIASNGTLEKMDIMLQPSGILTHFKNAVFSAYSVKSWKPDPGLFHHAATAMNVNFAQCVVIEDSVTGVLAAKRAGMACFGYAPDHNGANLAREGAVVFHDMGELPGLLTLENSFSPIN